MAKTEKMYERIAEAEAIVKSLVEKEPEVLWRVNASRIAVLGVTNKERGKKQKTLIKVTPIKGIQKAINLLYNVPISFAIEMYCSDWGSWNKSFREWILMKALLHIGEEEGKIIKTDCDDFKIILDAVGVNWEERTDLPSIIDSKVEFNLELRPALDEENDGNDGNDDKEEKEEDKEV